MPLDAHAAPRPGADASAALLAELAGFHGFGRATRAELVNGIPTLVGEFWTAAQRQSHSIHEVSYRACFKAELPAFFIARLTRPGGVVHDPFMGRGTTPVQAALMGRRAVANDVNPLSTLLTRPRLRPVEAAEVEAALRGIDWTRGEIGREDLLAFYHPGTLRQIEALRGWLRDRAPLEDRTPDPVADWIRMVALSRLSGHSAGYFSGRSMPPNQAVSVAAQRRINERLGLEPPLRDVPALILRKTCALLKDGPPPQAAGPELHTGPAWSTPGIASASVDLVVTSPPFLDIVDYAGDNWLRCWFADIDASQVEIACLASEEAWTEMVHRVLREQARLLRSGGHVAFEVGEVRGGRVRLEELVWQAAEGLPFERLSVVIHAQRFSKTSNLWGVANGRRGTNTNRIVLLRRL